MRGFACVLAILLILIGSATGQPKPRLFVTSGDSVRAERTGLVSVSASAKPDLTIDLADRHQAMAGFGGAFNEQGWVALLSLDEQTRQRVLKSIFSPSEANLSWGRIPIGASDYALERYTLAPVANDFGMANFTLERDKKYLIPYVAAAKAIRPDLKLWGSAWTPPIWMKDNNAYEGGNFIDKDEYYAAYALYLERFAEEYGKLGLGIAAVAVQNEPTVVTGYPNGGWKPQQFQKFIRDYAGPLFAQRKPDTAIWLATLNEGNYFTFARTVLDDPLARKYVAAVGLQWDGDLQIPLIESRHPGTPIIQTETDCGNWHWKPGFNPRKAPNDFAYAAYTWGRIRDYLSAGAEAYMLWNIVLDQKGWNIDKRFPWPQNSGIVVDTAARTVTYTPMFRAFEHFSRYVPDGSVLVGEKGRTNGVIAFVDPKGAVIVELMNIDPKEATIAAKVGGSVYSVTLPPECFATLIIK